MSAPWHRFDPATRHLTLTLHVQPNARKSEVVGPHGDALKVKIAAPALENRANATLVEFLSVALEVPKSAIVIRHGATGRRKIVEIVGGPELAAKLGALAGRSSVHDPRSTPTSK